MCSVARGWTVGFLQILGLKALSDFLHGSALFLALLDELVVNIRDIGHIDNLVAAVFQIAAQGIEDDERAGIADVDIVVDGGAADIDAVFTGHLRHKFLFLTGQGVEDLHGKITPFCGTDRSRDAPSGALHPAKTSR